MTEKQTHTPWTAGDCEQTVWRAEIDDFDYQPREGCSTSQPVMQGDETVCLVVGEGWDDTEFDRRLNLIAQAPAMLEALIKLRGACMGFVPECADEVDAVIAAATGEAP